MTETIACVVCSYKLPPQKIADNLLKMGRAMNKHFLGVIVCNQQDVRESEYRGWRIIQGTNNIMDMSAYREGINVIEKLNPFYKTLLILNDTLITNHNLEWNIKNIIKYNKFCEQELIPCIVGKTDEYRSICFNNPWSKLRYYVSSYCFLLNSSGVLVFKDVYDNLGNEFPDFKEFPKQDSWGRGLDPAFRAYLRMHLTTNYDANSWYKAEAYRNETRVLDLKLLCVYLEHKISGRIGHEGIIISINSSTRIKFSYFIAEQIAKIKQKF